MVSAVHGGLRREGAAGVPARVPHRPRDGSSHAVHAHAIVDPARATPEGLIALQALAGNRAVAGLVQQPVVQRNGAQTRVKSQVLGMAKTTNPLFGWKGYYKSLADVWVADDRKERYGSNVMRIIKTLSETTDRVASYFTAATLICTAVGLITIPFWGAGSAFLAAATIFGQIATIAHAVTFVLRLIQTIVDGIRLHYMGPEHPMYAKLKAQQWANVTGMISNAIGMLLGGLGGGFIGGQNIIGGASSAITKGVGEQAASGVGALMGEGANRVADAATGEGKVRGAKAEQKATELRQKLVAQGTAPKEVIDLADIEVDLDGISTAAKKDKGTAMEDTRTGAAVKQGAQQTTGKTDELVGKKAELDSKSEDAQAKTDELTEQSKKKPDAVSEDKSADVEAAEKKVAEIEAQEGVESETEPLPPIKKEKRPGKVKRFFTGLLARVTNVWKRVKKLAAKIRLKVLQGVVKVTGLKKPLLEMSAESKQIEAKAPEGVADDVKTEALASDAEKKVELLKVGAAKTSES